MTCPIEHLYRAHHRYVVQVLRHYRVAEADLEDLCNDVFEIVIRQLERFEGRSQIRTWLHGICRWTAANYRRRQATRARFTVACQTTWPDQSKRAS